MKNYKKILKKLEKWDRYNVFIILLFIMMALLFIKLSYLTIAKGDYYRDLSRNNRLRQIIIKAPRGNIYDRNGKLLAGTRVEYVAVLRKEKLQANKAKKNNNQYLKLARILEKDGSYKTDDFPFDLNTFSYRNKDIYQKEELLPDEYVLSKIIDEDLFKELINQKKVIKTPQGNYEFSILNKTISALKDKGIDLKINRNKNMKFDEKDEVTVNVLREFDLTPSSDVLSSIAKIVSKDKTVVRKVMEHPIGRQIIYDKLKEKKLEGQIVLDPLTLKDYRLLINKKASLNKVYKKITFESSAIDDFVQIVNQSTLHQLLQTVGFDESNREIVPAKRAIELLKAKGIESNITYEVFSNGENPSTMIKYKENHGKEKPAIDELIELLHQHKLVKPLVTDDEVKFVAQELNTKNNINPSISIKNWEYSFQKNIRDYYEFYGVDEKESFQKLYDKVSEKYDAKIFDGIDRFNVLAIHNSLKNKGGLAYEPINLTYNISSYAVSQIEENFQKDQGIEISNEPIRYYPNGELASHLLGYIGKISTENEIDEFINKKQYSRNQFIGKTGIENSQENSLAGKDGYLRILVDNKGNRTETLNELKAKAGSNVNLSIDLDLQKVAEKSLYKTLKAIQTGSTYESDWGNKPLAKYGEAKSGATVVVDVKTGEVLAMASAPSYNPNLFTTGISSTDWESLQASNESDPISPRPLLNMSMQSAIQPGSIFKLSTSLAALETGWDPNTIITCGGFVQLGTKTFGCFNWNTKRTTDGPENIKQAIQNSCNYFFYSLALGKDQRQNIDLGYKLNINELLKYTKELGLGERTGIGINIPSESKGTLPDPDIKISNFNKLYMNFLKKNARSYLKENVNEKELNKKIDELFKLTERQEVPSRKEVIEVLESLGFEPEKPINNEKQGFADKIKFDYLNQAGWKMADSLNVVIGQGQNAYTPLQMARYMSIFANGGYKNNLSVVKEVKSRDNESVLYKSSPKSSKIKLKDYNNLNIIREGTLLAATEGDEKDVFNKLPVKIGLKTGTAEIGKNILTGEDYDSNAWMIAFAPYDNPQIAVCTVIVQGGTSHNTGPMMRDIIAQALNLKPNGKDDNNTITKRDDQEELHEQQETNR